MNKNFFKLFSLTIALALISNGCAMQLARAAGEPAAPSLLRKRQASLPGDLAITLTWSDNSLDETAFEIERCIGSGCTDFVLIATRDSSIWGPWYAEMLDSLRSLTYSYRVRAVNAAGASEYSNVSSATTSYARPNGQVTSLDGTFTNGVVAAHLDRKCHQRDPLRDRALRSRGRWHGVHS